jgi:hypothetical protein
VNGKMILKKQKIFFPFTFSDVVIFDAGVGFGEDGGNVC